MKGVRFLGVMILVGLNFAAQNQALQTGNLMLTDENVDQIKVGMTRSDVLEILGDADEVVVREDGGKEWLYRGAVGTQHRPAYFSKKTTLVRAKLLTVTLSDKGSVTNVKYDEIQEKTKSAL